MVRLIRSKGVGVYFITQNPLDIPDTVLGQLGNRVQHALHAFTPRDQKAVKTAATTLRANPELDVEKVIGELGVGEALVSLLDEKGRPTVVERAFILPPHSRIGPATADERRAAMRRSLVAGVYENTVDRESAHEVLKARREEHSGRNADCRRLGAGQRTGRRTGRRQLAPPVGRRSDGDKRGARDRFGSRPPHHPRRLGVDTRRRQPALIRAPMPHDHARPSLAGTACVLLAAMAFSAKAVIVKLAYAYAVDAATLLALRMLFSAPFFVLMALWSGRGAAVASLTRKTGLRSPCSDHRYYLAS